MTHSSSSTQRAFQKGRAFTRYLRTGRRDAAAPGLDYECKFNANHDDLGRFTFATGAGSGSGRADRPGISAAARTSRQGRAAPSTPGRNAAVVASEGTRAPKAVHISSNGAKLIRGDEEFRAHIYRPKGDGSGVTIGYGYDMGARTKQEIYDDLTSVGMPPDQASSLSQAAGKKGASADNFIAAQKGGATLSEPQALRLFSSKIQGYELAVQQAVTVPLNQNQFDALTSLAYNAPAALKRGSRLVQHLNNADYQSAADEILRWNKVTVRGKTVPSRGLTKRRIRERALFLRGNG